MGFEDKAAFFFACFSIQVPAKNNNSVKSSNIKHNLFLSLTYMGYFSSFSLSSVTSSVKGEYEEGQFLTSFSPILFFFSPSFLPPFFDLKIVSRCTVFWYYFLKLHLK